MGRLDLPDKVRDEDRDEDRFQWEHIAAQIVKEAIACDRPWSDIFYALWDELEDHAERYA